MPDNGLAAAQWQHDRQEPPEDRFVSEDGNPAFEQNIGKLYSEGCTNEM